MQRHDEKYFTIWYGVYERTGRRLSYANAGHPPALLLTGPDAQQARPIELGQEYPPVGMFPHLSITGASVDLEAYSRLYVYSDGVYEIRKSGGGVMTREELVAYLSAHPGPSGPDEVWQFIEQVAGSPAPRDDFSLLEIQFA
jgi:sigma-B regulation protein RsbU (phosphoserine phosphatase)